MKEVGRPGDINNLGVVSSFFSFPLTSFLCGGDRDGSRAEDNVVSELSSLEDVGRDEGFGSGGVVHGLEVADAAITLGQRKKHRGWLKTLEGVESSVQLVRKLENMRTSIPWKYSTTSTKIGEIIGAVKRTEEYGGQRRLKAFVETAVFADYKRGIQLKALEEEPRSPVPLSATAVERVLEALAVDLNWETCVALALQWATAARPNCVMKLQVRNVWMEEDGVRVKFVAGKGVAARGEPYTVHTTLGRWDVAVHKWLKKRGAQRFVFEQERTERIKHAVRGALRSLNVQLGLRSIRRGAAICLADKGVPLKVIMHFTGHKSKEMCLRYLDWGWNWGEMQELGREAAQALWEEDPHYSSPGESDGTHRC